MNTYVSIRLICLALCLGFMGCGGAAQSLIQQSGAAHEQVEKMNWVNEPSAQASDWGVYMDLEH